MKLTSSIVLSTLCWSARLASAANVHVYLFDSDANEVGSAPGLFSNLVSGFKSEAVEQTPRELSPEEARVVIAQRAGIKDFYDSSLGKPGVLDAINNFGLSTSLFGEKELRSKLILVEADEETAPSLQHSSSFTVSPAPSYVSAEQLLTTLSHGRSEDSDAGHGCTLIRIRAPRAELESRWKDIVRDTTRDSKTRTAVTMVVFPPSAMTQETSTDAHLAWMSFSGLLVEEVSPRFVKRESFSPEELTSSPLKTRQDDNQSGTVIGILPACFQSQSQCESSTHNCSGHGSCGLSFRDTTYENPRQCYSCSCSPTFSEGADGRKSTTYWGGPACQKKDISAQFWLIALFSVGLVSLISFAVGTLWSMGDETLPSVIGAGVSGPAARR